MKPSPDDLVCLGKIIDAYGVRGWVKIRPYSEPEVLFSVKNWWIQRTSPVGVQPEPISKSIVEVKKHSGLVVAFLEGCDSRNAAEQLKGYEVYVSRSLFPKAAPDSFYWIDLIGCQVYSVQQPEQPVGVVLEVTDNGAQSLLVVQPYDITTDGALVLRTKNDKPITSMIPFVTQFVPEVHIEQKTILIDWSLDW